jgi:hypothetical protein
MMALLVGIIAFWRVESGRIDVRARLHQAVTNNTLTLAVADAGPALDKRPRQLTVLYAYDGKEQVASADSKSQDSVLRIAPGPKDKSNAQLEIKRAKLGPAPDATLGYLIFACLLVYLAGFAVGPGVCLWLMSSELMPTRIRSFGMGVGVLCNALVSIGTVAIFLPMVGIFGYAAMWGVWFICTALYFCLAAFIRSAVGEHSMTPRGTKTPAEEEPNTVEDPARRRSGRDSGSSWPGGESTLTRMSF